MINVLTIEPFSPGGPKGPAGPRSPCENKKGKIMNQYAFLIHSEMNYGGTNFTKHNELKAFGYL